MTPSHPAYGELRRVSPVTAVLLERNPSPMTLEGTNSWIVRARDDAPCVVIDPGHDDHDHLERLAAAAGEVELVLLTHHHPDHAEGASRFADQVRAPVRAFAPAQCHGAGPLVDGEVVAAGELVIRVLHTPGHTADSVTFVLDRPERSHVFTGDTILGRGTTVLSDLGEYLYSLRLLSELPGGALGLPGHGAELGDLTGTVREYLEHRQQRLDQIRQALRVLGRDASARAIVEYVYSDTDPALWGAAEESVRAQLDYLRTRPE
ncbi:MBL fold metallo-hydrolase [Haloechinothrix sp. LS1_15]|uniref:MBL fold metallo-hydrolase n=1 Tax=Haloechinothrix sp. LS1_15 TaxID=2652248 RepID=UPI00294450E7|nr:MBL fold metallo-hydrolase [Haloechinothrix sp. LS1_15]MDV6011338.1 MBL fold metallo-hydrolase [Haloechinothrix sp. LS1_15]